MDRPTGRGPEDGFTLVEMLIVITILPLIMGGIAVALVVTLKNQSVVSDRLSDSSSAQVASAFYVRDVQSAAYVTTSPSTNAPGPCGTRTTFVLSLTWNSPAGASTVVSYWVRPGTGTSVDLVRWSCTPARSPSAVTVARGLLLNTGIKVGVTPPGAAGHADADWTSTAGISSITLSGLESASSFHFDLQASPRMSGNPAVPPLLLLGTGHGQGGAPVLSCDAGQIIVNGPAFFDSTADPSGRLTGNATFSATQILTSDTNTAGAVVGGTSSPAPTYRAVQPDPYAGLPPPSTTDPGVHVFTSPLSFSGSQTQAVLPSGIYILEQGIRVAGGASLSSSPQGVLLYVTGGAVDFSGAGNVSLSPLRGHYPAARNLTVWQSGSDTQPLSLAGTGSVSRFTGAVYAPGAQVRDGGSAGFTAGSVLASSLACTGGSAETIG